MVDELKDIILKNIFLKINLVNLIIKNNELKDKFLLNLLDKNYNTKSLHYYKIKGNRI